MTARTQMRRMITPLQPPGSIEALIRKVAAQKEPAILESADHSSPWGRYSIFCWDPVDVISFDQDSIGNPWDVLADRIGRSAPQAASSLPFTGGWIGFIAYEAGYWLESIAPLDISSVPTPILRFAYYDTAVVADHETKQWFVAATETTKSRSPLEERIASASDLVTLCECSGDSGANGHVGAIGAHVPIATNMTREEYIARVERIKEYIAAGDVYQVNFAQRFHASTSDTPGALYGRLRTTNPAAFSALLAWGESAVISSSPELFLHLSDHEIITRPIKGTRPRSSDPKIDDQLRRELTDSEKDRAELAMIVDLLRNDLGRVCTPGSVKVLADSEIERHPTVWHLVATIKGRVPNDAGPVDLLRATFPGGSITGAPKIRAMQIIHELEPDRRGVYCGAIGMIDAGGQMTFNIAIRTLWLNRGALSWQAGGGIVADSVPESEYDETLAKSAGLRRVVEEK